MPIGRALTIIKARAAVLLFSQGWAAIAIVRASGAKEGFMHLGHILTGGI